MALAESADFTTADDFTIAVARNIRTLLAMRSTTAKSLARSLGMSDTKLSQRMTGSSRWLGFELTQVAAALSAPIGAVTATTESDFVNAMRLSGSGYDPDINVHPQPTDARVPWFEGDGTLEPFTTVMDRPILVGV